jgi:hypothetical protein
MNDELYPWRQPKSIDTVFAEVKPVFASLAVIAPDAGCSEAEIAAAEQRSRPFPCDVRAFYRAMRPTELFDAGDQKEFGFYTIESAELRWRPMEGAEPKEDWLGAQGLFLGQSEFGDPFGLTEGHRSAPDGSIFLLNHDGGMGGGLMFVRFARSFREFLAKLAYFKNLYSTPRDALFHREYVELNPSVKL